MRLVSGADGRIILRDLVFAADAVADRRVIRIIDGKGSGKDVEHGIGSPADDFAGRSRALPEDRFADVDADFKLSIGLTSAPMSKAGF